jgi:hypothetical protein
MTQKGGMPRALPGSVRSTPSSAGENGWLSSRTDEQLDLLVISPQRRMSQKGGMSRALPGSVRSTPSSAGENVGIYSRMDRLRALFEDLHREVAENGSEGGDSVRAAELRGRISELMREESTAGSTSGSGSTRGPASEVGNLAPPAYEQD